MTPTPQVQVKVDNNALFAERLRTHPPEYELGATVIFKFTQNGSGNTSIGTVTGRVFNERDNSWKYTVNPNGLNNFHVDAIVIKRYNER